MHKYIAFSLFSLRGHLRARCFRSPGFHRHVLLCLDQAEMPSLRDILDVRTARLRMAGGHRDKPNVYLKRTKRGFPGFLDSIRTNYVTSRGWAHPRRPEHRSQGFRGQARRIAEGHPDGRVLPRSKLRPLLERQYGFCGRGDTTCDASARVFPSGGPRGIAVAVA